jgi:hypothetical protein
MSASPIIASLAPEPAGTAASASGSTQTPVPLDTGSISGNLLVLAASLANGQQQSTGQLSEMRGHLNDMSGHLKSLADGSSQFYAALGVKPGDPTAQPTFAIHDQSIEKMVDRLSDKLQPKFAEQSAATAALSKRVDEHAEQITASRHDIAVARTSVSSDENQLAVLHQRMQQFSDRLDNMQGRQTGDEATGGLIAAVTQEQMSELTAVVERLRVQVHDLLTHRLPGRQGDEPPPASHSPANRRRP